MLTLSLLLAAAAAPPKPAAAPNPLAPAAEGKLECYSPDAAKKTCKSLAAYRPRPDGGYDSLSLIILQPNPLVTLQMVSPVRVRNGQVCGPVREADIQQASFQVNGQAVTPEQTAEMRGKVRALMAPLLGKEVCTQYLPAPDGARIARSVEAGKPRPELDQKVIWISQSDGYKVAP
jgi:hypothetical protein